MCTDRHQNGPICLPQQPTDWTVTGGSTRFTTGEDCLFVSVFAPTDADTTSELPVMFFIQGGGFGSLSSANWDPSELVREENVVFPVGSRHHPQPGQLLLQLHTATNE